MNVVAKYTPGPWIVADDGTVESRFHGRVCTVAHATPADAQLIAAAPALLYALMDLLDEHNALTVARGGDPGKTDTWPLHARAAREAISKALGDSRW
jgi:hypothetical protein